MAHPEEQVDGTPPRIGPHETGERADTGSRPDQDQGRAILTRMETGIPSEECGYGVARFERHELPRTEAAGVFPDHDLDEAVAVAGGERIEPRHGGALRHDAEKVARREAREARPVRRCQIVARGMAKRRIAVGACTSTP